MPGYANRIKKAPRGRVRGLSCQSLPLHPGPIRRRLPLPYSDTSIESPKMKHGTGGAPFVMVHRLNRMPQACKACREKKRRCDRAQPCANCSLRQLRCAYVESAYATINDTVRQEPEVSVVSSHDGNPKPSASSAPPPSCVTQLPAQMTLPVNLAFKALLVIS
jgi:hypothetical protein